MNLCSFFFFAGNLAAVRIIGVSVTYNSKVFVEQELTVIDYKEGLGMHTLEHMKVHRCTDQLII